MRGALELTRTPEPVGTLEVALAHAERLLARQPRLAAEQALEILKTVPGQPRARLVLGAAHRLVGKTQAALAVLEPLAREQPRAAPVYIELGIAQSEAGRVEDALVSLSRALQWQPDSQDAWRVTADLLDAQGDVDGSDQARAQYIKAATGNPVLREAAAALVENRLPAADARLRSHLQKYPTDIAALRMLAEVAARLRRYADAQSLLERCLELAPGFDAARYNYAMVLNRQGKAQAALFEVERLLAQEPRNPGYRNLAAAVRANLGDYVGSIEAYEALLREFPRQPKVWMSYGHALKTAGRQSESIAAYRRGIELEPTLGEAWWSLANLKTFRFLQADVAAICSALAREDLTDEDRLHFEFALGKALEDEGSYADSFIHYAHANAVHRKTHHYDSEQNSSYVRRSKQLFTPEFFASRAGAGATAADPIFIVGLPRAGSTLLEQILASHPLVEGTMELPHIPQIATDIARGGRDREGDFLSELAMMTPARLRALGERYIAETRRLRKTDAPFFIDKMPNNCLYVGLIHLILPNARLIDARRHPLGCGFSCFKQHFARGQSFTYALEDIGRYYRDYVDLLAHFDAVLPGRVHRVFYERMIEDTHTEVRRLLAHCGLPFDAGCLKFFENDRAVRTASSEQVRQPIFRDGLDHWRHYESWLEPLRTALGPVLSAYRAEGNKNDT
jgi:tetratricopeptide (TPR) repeat protein